MAVMVLMKGPSRTSGKMMASVFVPLPRVRNTASEIAVLRQPGYPAGAIRLSFTLAWKIPRNPQSGSRKNSAVSGFDERKNAGQGYFVPQDPSPDFTRFGSGRLNGGLTDPWYPVRFCPLARVKALSPFSARCKAASSSKELYSS